MYHGGERRKKRRKEKRRKGREERERERRERERERERENKGRQRWDASIPHFLRKMNCVLSSLLTEEREIEGLKRQKKKIKLMWYICFFFGLIGPIL
jgi:hypothetical protein